MPCEEADADSLTLDDIQDVLLNGDLNSIYTDDLRGPRSIIRGLVDENQADVVFRFRSDGTLLIVVTVYGVD